MELPNLPFQTTFVSTKRKNNIFEQSVNESYNFLNEFF
jgi:hypothetical protein